MSAIYIYIYIFVFYFLEPMSLFSEIGRITKVLGSTRIDASPIHRQCRMPWIHSKLGTAVLPEQRTAWAENKQNTKSMHQSIYYIFWRVLYLGTTNVSTCFDAFRSSWLEPSVRLAMFACLGRWALHDAATQFFNAYMNVYILYIYICIYI